MKLLVAVALLLAAFTCQAQTAWPAYIHSLQPDLSDSPVAAVLPDDVAITPPGAEVRPERRRWSGTWRGWACAGQVCDVKVAVERIDENGATVAYAGASATASNVHRGEARFAGEELHLRLHTGANLVLRLRADGDMEMSLWRPDSQLLSAGVLTQRPSGRPGTAASNGWPRRGRTKANPSRWCWWCTARTPDAVRGRRWW